MTTEQAGRLVREYLQVLADPSNRGHRMDPVLLPCSKEDLMRAIKIVIAQLHLNYADTAERVDPLVRAAMALDSFSTLPVDSADYIGAMQARRREIYEFQKELRQIPTADPITYLGQVYSLIGIDYEGPRTTFLQSLRARLASRRRVSAGSPAVIRP